ncbi:MAG: thermonuclease family protein [Henriciella sp.]
MGLRLETVIAGLVLMLGAACSKAGPLEDMEKGETGRVVRVVDGDALVLDTGQSVRLVGIEAPALNPRYGDPQPYAEQAKRGLEDLVLGREVRLYYPGLTRDRYDRALAHVGTADGTGPDYWVNLELVRRGHVRVRLYPDTDGGGVLLMDAEKTARAEGLGLWAYPAYRPTAIGRLAQGVRGFSIVDGIIAGEADLPEEEERRTLCSFSLEDGDLILDIAFTARPLCDTPPGSPVRVRGWIQDQRMELVHPLHLERLESERP